MPKLTTFRGKSRWPMPVYVATLTSGETVRVSFWSPADRALDLAAGRACAAYQCGTDGTYPKSSSWNGGWRHLPPKIPAEIVAGHVEFGEETFADPMTAQATVWPAGEAPKRRAGPSSAAMRDALRLLAASGNADVAAIAAAALAA